MNRSINQSSSNNNNNSYNNSSSAGHRRRSSSASASLNRRNAGGTYVLTLRCTYIHYAVELGNSVPRHVADVVLRNAVYYNNLSVNNNDSDQ